MVTINTNFGSFSVVENKSINGVKVIRHDDVSINIPNVPYWDKDTITNKIYEKKDVIMSLPKVDTPTPSVNTSNSEVKQDNVVTLLEKVNSELQNIEDKKERGFVCSRITQVVNKLKSIGY